MNENELIKMALDARNLSYSPYSHFKVGAVLVCKDDALFKGSNIENASYSLCMCAERNAIFQAVLNGYKKGDFKQLFVVGGSSVFCSPCGACLQVMSEFFDDSTEIFILNNEGKYKKFLFKELLPYTFDKDSLNV